MRTSFLITCLTILSLFGQAQINIYHPFPTSDVTWREWYGGYQCGYCTDYQNVNTGDTIIGGQHYSKIRKTGVIYNEDYSGHCSYQINSYYSNIYNGAYRNDSINKKVYYVPPAAVTDTLLYDFNLNLYDTLHQSYLYNSAIMGICYVDEIDSVLINSKYHKEFRITQDGAPGIYFYLIEGIGSSYGLLASLMPYFECGSFLRCVIEEGRTVYPDSSYSCDLITSSPEIPGPVFFTKFYPNPVTDFASVDFPPNVDKIDLSITNILGIEILRINGLKDGEKIDLSTLQEGLYLYKVSHGTSIISIGKLIKIE